MTVILNNILYPNNMAEDYAKKKSGEIRASKGYTPSKPSTDHYAEKKAAEVREVQHIHPDMPKNHDGNFKSKV